MTQNNGKLILFFKVFIEIDSICYDYIAANKSLVEKQIKKAAWKYCYEKYKRSLEGVKVNFSKASAFTFKTLNTTYR